VKANQRLGSAIVPRADAVARLSRPEAASGADRTLSLTLSGGMVLPFPYAVERPVVSSERHGPLPARQDEHGVDRIEIAGRWGGPPRAAFPPRD